MARLVRQETFTRDVSLAWHIEALHRQKKLPSLRALVAPKAEGTRQTTGQMRTMLTMLSETYGGSIRTKRRRA